MLGTQSQQHEEKPDTFKMRGLCPCNWFCSLESHLPSFYRSIFSHDQNHPRVLTLAIHSCVCLCDSPQMLASSQLDGLVADAPCGDILMYTYMYMCTCLCVSSVKTTVHSVVLVCTLSSLSKTFVLRSLWSQGIDRDSVCGSSAVVVDPLGPDGILH